MGRVSKVGVSAKKAEVLRFIEDFLADKGYSPTIREIANGVGLASTASAHRYVKDLCAQGALCVAPKLNRTITITSK